MRRFESGAQKRKAKKLKDEFDAKLPKLTTFFNADLRVLKDVNVDAHNNNEISSEKITENVENSNCEKDLSEFEKNIEIAEKLNISNNNLKNILETTENTDKNLTEQTDNFSNCLDELSKDPALWQVNESIRQRILDKGFEYFQNKNSDFSASGREYKSEKRTRYFQSSYFVRILANQEKHERKWMMYSESTGNVFCYACKLFSNNLENSFVGNGFSDWKHGHEKIKKHENSTEHKNCMMVWLTRRSHTPHIDDGLNSQLNAEIEYWKKVLKRVVEVIRFLTERGLAFRGTHEKFGSPDNGNYLGILELIAKFDPFLEKHIDLHGNKGRGHVSLLSKTIFEELIDLMAKKVSKHISAEIKEAKYFGLIVDSTPDISYVDQLSIIIRYCLHGTVYERFLTFIPISSHTGESLCDVILKVLSNHGICIDNCRGQSYDNASNMSGKYSGVQARMKKINPLAVHAPCAGHSVNLAGRNSVSVCTEAISYFNFVSGIYAFFVGSPHRWEILKKHSDSSLKSLSKTRWSCHDDATAALFNNYSQIYDALSEIIENSDESAETRFQAKNLQNQFIKLETAIMTVFWHEVLDRFNKTNKFLQAINIDLSIANNMLKSLIEFTQVIRHEFTEFEEKAIKLGTFVCSQYHDENKRRKTKKFADGTVEKSKCLKGKDKFKIESFLVMVDQLTAELEKRSAAYNEITEMFNFLMNLRESDDFDEIKECANKLVDFYPADLENTLVSELEQFIPFLKLEHKNEEKLPATSILKWMVDSNVTSIFPNVYIAFRIFLSIPVTNCEAERSFSALSRIKSERRSTMAENRLVGLSLLAIERELLRDLSFDDIIDEFAKQKARKRMCNI